MTEEINQQPEDNQPAETEAATGEAQAEVAEENTQSEAAATSANQTNAGDTPAAAETPAQKSTDATPTGPARKIQIGSRRQQGESDKPRGAKPHVGGKAPADAVVVPNKAAVPIPSVRDQLSQDLEDEIAAALRDPLSQVCCLVSHG